MQITLENVFLIIKTAEPNHGGVCFNTNTLHERLAKIIESEILDLPKLLNLKGILIKSNGKLMVGDSLYINIHSMLSSTFVMMLFHNGLHNRFAKLFYRCIHRILLHNYIDPLLD